MVERQTTTLKPTERIMPNYKMKFEEPQYIELDLPGFEFPKIVDLFACSRAVEEADRQPTVESKYAFLKSWIAAQMGYPLDDPNNLQIAESTAYDFREQIVTLMNVFTGTVKKKLQEIVSSQPFTTPSQQNQTTAG